MTLREPSFLAAATSASMPPASSADVAVAASPPEPPSAPLSLAGGAQAARAVTPTAATSESRRVLLVMRDLRMRDDTCVGIVLPRATTSPGAPDLHCATYSTFRHPCVSCDEIWPAVW